MDSFKTSLLTPPHANTKLRKTLAKTGVAVYSLALAPAQSSGVANLCPGSSPGCRAHCVGAEHNGMSRKYRRIFPGRIARTKWLVDEPMEFRRRLSREAVNAAHKHYKRGERCDFRLNCYSDLAWWKDLEVSPILEELNRAYGCVSFDYTAIVSRYRAWFNARPAYYHMVLSRKEHTPLALVKEIIALGGQVAVAFSRMPPIGATWYGMPTTNGDISDLIYTQPAGRIIALVAKGSARQDTSGFVVDHPWGSSPGLRDRSGLSRRLQAERAREEYDRRCMVRSVWESRAEILPATMALLRIL